MVVAVAQSPVSGHVQSRSGRKPLQPKNSSFNSNPKPNASPTKPEWSQKLAHNDNNNKENLHRILSSTDPPKTNKINIKESSFQLDASLAEELSAIREKLERLRIDKEKTDEMLKERGVRLDSQMKEMVDREMFQKQLEMEVDRLFRLKEIKLSCTSISPLRSLRDKEQAKKANNNHTENSDQRKEETPLNSTQ